MHRPCDYCGQMKEAEVGGDGKGILRALFILQLEILEEERLGRKWKSMFPGLKADQCGLTAVSNQGKRRASSSREALQTHIGQSFILLGPVSSMWRGAVEQEKKVSPRAGDLAQW